MKTKILIAVAALALLFFASSCKRVTELVYVQKGSLADKVEWLYQEQLRLNESLEKVEGDVEELSEQSTALTESITEVKTALAEQKTWTEGELEKINKSVADLEKEQGDFKAEVYKRLGLLESRIQKIDVIPNHASGGVWIKNITENEFNFLISPDSLASKLLAGFNANKTSFILLATKSLTKAATFDTIRFAATVAESGGVLTFKVDGKQSNNKFCKNFYTACLQIKDSVNCSTSGFFPLARLVYPEAPDSACITIGTTTWAPVNCGYDEDNYKYGKLYQWGRKDGCGYDDGTYKETIIQETSTTTDPIAAKDENKTIFYQIPNEPADWLTPQDSTRWNGNKEWPGKETSPTKTNYDPCPAGWRVPTYAELDALTGNGGTEGIGSAGWDSANKGYWFNGTKSPKSGEGLFLPAAGERACASGDASGRDSYGDYWSSSVIDYDDDGYARKLFFFYDSASMSDEGRAGGFSVRCVRE